MTRASGNAKTSSRKSRGGPSSTTVDQSRRASARISGQQDPRVSHRRPALEGEDGVQIELDDLRAVRHEPRHLRDDLAQGVEVGGRATTKPLEEPAGPELADHRLGLGRI